MLFALSLLSFAAEAPHLRPAAFDTQGLPKVIAPLDVKRTQSGWPALNAQDFRLLEDGATTSQANRIARFRDENIGLALIVALDASGSMNGRPLTAIKQGLAQLVGRKRGNDRVAVLSFADDTHWETQWDTSDQATQDAFKNLQTRGNLTRLYDALEDAINEFSHEADKDEDFPVRRCILVISDGHDEGSHATLAQLLNHIQASRVRFDAVGLAHSPLWLGSLRQMAKTGFGEFQTTSSPEGLTDLLGHGIDALLDMPTLEFQAEHLTRDGKTHQIGLEDSAASLRDELSVKLPEPFWRTKQAVYYGSAAIVLAILFALLLWRFSKPKQVPAPAVAASAVEIPSPSPPPKPPPLRAATVAEPGASVVRPMNSAPVISYTAPAPAPAATLAPKPARVPTALAPNQTSAVSKLSLLALTGPYAGRSFPVTEVEFWIGSAANNHLCLSADDGISGNHACIRTEQSFRRLYDNGSLNNTWLNGRAIGQEVALLQPGDRLRLGASDFLLEANGDA